MYVYVLIGKMDQLLSCVTCSLYTIHDYKRTPLPFYIKGIYFLYLNYATWS